MTPRGTKCDKAYYPLLCVLPAIHFFFAYRARIEKDYGESLVRLAKNSSGRDEIGYVIVADIAVLIS